MKIIGISSQSFGLKIKQTPAMKEVIKGWKTQYSDWQIQRALERIKNMNGNEDEVEFVKTRSSRKKNHCLYIGKDMVTVKITKKDGEIIKKDLNYAYPLCSDRSCSKIKKDYEVPIIFAERLIDTYENPNRPSVNKYIREPFI